MKERDIKYMGVPNICFSLLSDGDGREKEYAEQRVSRGFDDSETWDVGCTIMNFAIPRLERYIKIAKESLDELEFITKCEKVLRSFVLLTRNDGLRLFNEKEKTEVKEGLSLLPETIEGMWW